MPDAVDVAIAKAVVSQLEAATLSQTIEPERSDAEWERPLETDGTDVANQLYVDVVPVATGKAAELGSRGTIEYKVPVDIAVRKRFGTDKQDDDTGRINIAEIDALKFLVQEIFELFMPVRLTNFDDAVWEGTKILVCPIKKHLREMRQFTGIVRITFRVYKAI